MPSRWDLAIRENTVYIHGTPTLPLSKTRVYLDIEGVPDRDFRYLIGALIVSDAQQVFHSFWADAQSDELNIFAQFIDTVIQNQDFQVFHFGEYDTAALKRVRPRLSADRQRQMDMIIEKSTNILSAIYPNVYFPSYSNGLKDIGRFVTTEPHAPEATGLQAVVWRSEWENQHRPDLKAALMEYNYYD